MTRFTKLLVNRTAGEDHAILCWCVALYHAMLVSFGVTGILSLILLFTGSYKTIHSLSLVLSALLVVSYLAIYMVVKEVFGPGDGLEQVQIDGLQAFCKRFGLETEVTVIKDLGSVNRADENDVVINWYDHSDGVKVESYNIPGGARIKGIRGGDEVRMRRIFHAYRGLPLIMESFKLVFSNSSHGEYYTESYKGLYKPHVYKDRKSMLLARVLL